MKLLITNAIICDQHSAYHGKKCHVFISQGIISDIQLASKKDSTTSTKGYTVIDANGATLTPGFVDMRTTLREPGFEYKETLQTAALAASAGGFTTITALPNTHPVMQTKADMEYVSKRAQTLPVHILPYGALTKNCEGNDMNELYDMHQAGAVGFTDANKCIMHAGVMMRSLMYAKIFGGLVLSHAEDTNLSSGGRMHEGLTSVNLGLKGIPNMAEEVIIARDLELAKYTQAPIHFSHISSKGSVELIKSAKKQGVTVTCDVAVANLVYNDEALNSFDSNFKLNPPLRSKADQKALWEGLNDGTIDCIVTDHCPEDVEHKVVEFEYAAKGMIMLQTAISLLLQHKPQNITKEVVINALTHNPRAILKQAQVSINTGNTASLCLIDEKAKWTFDAKTNQSKSQNSPVYNQVLTGKVLATFNKNNYYQY